MPGLRIDAVAVTATDMAASAAFWGLFGFDFGTVDPAADHLEAVLQPGGVRLMIDSAGLAQSLIGAAPKPANHSHFALLCESPAEVDRIAAAVAGAGHRLIDPPFDAFWGQRYAVLADPDGYRVDLFAPL